MVKQHYKNNGAFSFGRNVSRTLIVSIIVIILSRISINTYEKYQERLAVNELISEIYNVQTRSLNERRTFICFYMDDEEYDTFYDDHEHWKKN